VLGVGGYTEAGNDDGPRGPFTFPNAVVPVQRGRDVSPPHVRFSATHNRTQA